MRTILFVALLGVAASVDAAIPTPGFRYKNMYKPVVGVQKSLRPRIVGGEEAVPHSRPYQVFLEVHDATGGGWYCGGEVVSNNFLLTAGHCGDGGLEAIITLGAHNILDPNEPTQIRLTTTDITVHPDFDRDQIINDISAFKFEEPIVFSDIIQPVALPTRADVGNTLIGETATLSGWGLTETFDMPPYLKVFYSPILPNSDCEALTGWVIPETQVCIADNGGGSCSGDSGGPVTVLVNGVDTLVGIVSYGVSLCLPGYPCVFTRVTEYLDWIESATDVEVH